MYGFSPKTWARAPKFRLFLGASSVSLWGNAVFDFAMPLYVWDRTGSPLALSLVAASLTLPYFVMAPLTGYAVDHFDNRKLLIAADIGQFALLSVLIGFDLADVHPLPLILAACFLVKSLAILFETVSTFCLIPALVPGKELASANTWFLSSYRLIQIIGPLVGGVAMTAFGFLGCAVFNVVSFAATLAFTVSMKDLGTLIDAKHGVARATKVSSKAIKRSFMVSVRYIWRSRLFRSLVLAMFCWNLSSLTPNAPTLTYYFRAVQGYSNAEYGYVIGGLGVAGILGFFASSSLHNRWGLARALIRSGLWQASIATVAVAFTRYPLVFAFLFGLSRVGSSVLSIGTFLIRQTRVPTGQMGAINATLRMFFMSAAPLSALAQGFMLERWGATLSFATGALCLWGTFWFSRGIAAECTEQASKELQAA